ncbi:MAG: hypothetical protein P8Z30_11690 [Acidobacteriota bacterium]
MKPAPPNGAQDKVYKSLRFDSSGDSKEGLLKNNTAGSPQNRSPVSVIQTLSSRPPQRRVWTFPEQGIAIFYGPGNVPKLSHYFLPRLLLKGKRVLFLDGANSANPRLLARLARERRVPFEQFNSQIEIARAFTCFQLTELIARVPRFLESFPADVLVVTALPDLYFDEDVRDWDARVAFEQAISNLGRLARQPLAIAIFSAAMTFTPSAARKNFFARTCRAGGEVWRFSLGENGRPNLICERGPADGRLKPAAALAK